MGSVPPSESASNQALVECLARALHQERGAHAEQLDLFPELLPLEADIRVVLRAFVIKANLRESRSPPLDANVLIAALTARDYPEPSSIVFRGCLRVRQVRELVDGLGEASPIQGSRRERILDRLGQFERQGIAGLRHLIALHDCRPCGLLQRELATMPPVPSYAEDALSRMRAEAFRVLLVPPRRSLEGARKVVTAFDCLRYVLDPVTRSATCETLGRNGVWTDSGYGWLLDAPILTWHWVNALAARHRAFFRDRMGRNLNHHAVESVMERLRSELDASGLIPLYREQLVEAITFDAEILRLARAIAPGSGRHQVDSLDYTAAWQDTGRWWRLIKEGGELAGLLRAAVKDEELEDDAGYRELKMALLAHGAGKGGWKYICRNGLKAFGETLARAPRRKVVRLAAFQARLMHAAGEHLDPCLVTTLFDCVHLLRQPETFTLPPRLLELANARILEARRDNRLQAFITAEWRPLMAWFVEVNPRIQRNQWAAGWDCLLQAKDIWILKQLAEDGPPEWSSPIETMHRGPYVAIPLVSLAQLQVEGIAMAHCVADYADRCRAGDYRVFSIRESLCNKRIATAGLKGASGRWVVDDVRGTANTRGSEEAFRMAGKVAHRCTQERPPPPSVEGSLEDLLAA